MPAYKSQGTVRFGIGSGSVWINFVPHYDYLVKHDGKNYAAFLPNGKGSCKGILIEFKDESGRPIEIRKSTKLLDMSEMLIWAGAQSAAMTHSKVQVEVDMTENGTNRKLTGIEIPPK